MAKKPTAKQLAARKKFAAIMKSGGFKKRKSNKTKTKSAKKRTIQVPKIATKKRKSILIRNKPKKTMARRRSMKRSVRRSGGKIGGFFKGGLIGKAVAGIGAATLVGVVMNQVAPQFSGIASPVAGFAAGGPVGGIASLLVSPTGLSGITSIFMPQQTSTSSGVMSV